MDRRELVEKMAQAGWPVYYPVSSAAGIRHDRDWKDFTAVMDAALSVAVEELLKEPAFEEKKQVATDYFDNHAHYALEAFIASRRAKLERVKTPEERVTLRDTGSMWRVLLDEKSVCTQCTEALAVTFRIGLIQQLKEEKN